MTHVINLIAIDMDGTLLNSQKKIPAANIEAIQKAAKSGVKIVLCTGRPKSGIIPYFDQLGLTEEEYIIMNNGCSVYNTKGYELLDYAQLTNDELDQLYDVIRKHPEVSLSLTSEEHYYIVGDDVPELVAYDAGLVFSDVDTIHLDEAKTGSEIIFQAMFMAPASALDSLQELQESELEKEFNLVRSQEYIFEAMPKGVTKATGLKHLAEILGYTADQIMAIGDAANDIEMLEYAGCSVAMGNASQAIKDKCRYVTSSNDEAGVAKAIYDYALS